MSRAHTRRVFEKLEKYNVGRIVVAEGRRPYFFNIVLSPEALENPEILYGVLEVFKASGVTTMALKVSAPSPGEGMRVILAADLSGREGMAEQLAGDVGRLEGVVRVDVAPPLFDGVAVDAWSHPLLLFNERAAILNETLIKTLLLEGFGKLGDGFGGVLFYTFFQSGKALFENVVSRVAGRVEHQITLFEELFRLLGFGVLDFVGFPAGEAVYRVYDGLEAKLLEGSGVEGEFATRGLLAGFTSALWGLPYGKVAVRETKCARRGDPYCEIHVVKLA